MQTSIQLTNNFLSNYNNIFGACLTALLIILAVYRRRRSKLSSTSLKKRIPGPRQFPLGKYLNLLEFGDRKRTLKVLSGWCEGQGPIVRLDFGLFNFVALLSPDYIQKLLGSTSPSHLGKPAFGYKEMKPVPWFDGIFISKGGKWKARRKLLNQSSLGHSSVVGYMPVLNRAARVLVRQLEAHFFQKSCDDEPIEPRPIYDLLFDTSMATLLNTVFSVDIHGGGDGEGGKASQSYKKFARMFKREMEIGGILIAQPWLSIEPIFSLHPISRERAAFAQFTFQFILGLLEERRRLRDDGNKSLLTDLVSAGLSPEGIYEETMSMIGAGLESTGGVLHSLLFFLALHPNMQEECREEVDSVFENEGDISASGLKQLGFLEQCVLETLRMTPPAPLFMRELSGPLTLDDSLELPAGTNVAVWLPGIHMNPEIYPEPDKFDPSRWTPEVRGRRHAYSYLPFSGGPRACIGIKLAMAELLILTAHILRHFTITTTTDRFADVTWLLNVTAQPETPMKFVFRKRHH